MASIGKKWSIVEEAQLVKELTEGKKYEEIAEIHERNINGVKSRHVKIIAQVKRLEQLAVAMKGSSLDELASKIKLSVENVITNPLFDECSSYPV